MQAPEWLGRVFGGIRILRPWLKDEARLQLPNDLAGTLTPLSGETTDVILMAVRGNDDVETPLAIRGDLSGDVLEVRSLDRLTVHELPFRKAHAAEVDQDVSLPA